MEISKFILWDHFGPKLEHSYEVSNIALARSEPVEGPALGLSLSLSYQMLVRTK